MQTFRTVFMGFFLIRTSGAFGNFMTILRLPDIITRGFLSISGTTWVILLMIKILLLILGGQMDMVPMIETLTPILLPVCTKLGLDPIQSGLVLIFNAGIGLLTPPVGHGSLCGLQSHRQGDLECRNEGDDVVIGAGPVGLFRRLLSKLESANHVCVMDVSRERLKLAEAFKLNSYVHVTEDGAHIQSTKGLNDGLGPSVVIAACSVAGAQVDSGEIVRKGTRVEFFGGRPKFNPYTNLNINLIHYR